MKNFHGSGITGTVEAFMSTARRNLFRLLHGEADALFLLVDFQHDDLDNVADGHDLGRVLDELVRHLRDVDKSILMQDRKSTRLNSSHSGQSRMPSSA